MTRPLSRGLAAAVAAVAAALIASRPGEVAAGPADPSIRVGAWNIEHLGNPKSRGVPNRNVAQDPKDLAHYVMDSRVDVLALEEVTAEFADGHPFGTNDTLDAAFAHLEAVTGADWEYRLFPKPKADDRNQCVGVAWNTDRAELVGEPEKIPVDATKNSRQKKRLFNRGAHAAKFSFGSGKTDLIVVPVHLKANTGGVVFDDHREDEVDELLAKLPGVIAAKFPGEADVVVLGDTNILKASEDAVAKLTGSPFGFKDLNKLDVDTYAKPGNTPFDRIYVPAGQDEFKFSKLRVVGMPVAQGRGIEDEKEFVRRLSDHFMVTTTVRVLDDDD